MKIKKLKNVLSLEDVAKLSRWEIEELLKKTSLIYRFFSEPVFLCLVSLIVIIVIWVGVHNFIIEGMLHGDKMIKILSIIFYIGLPLFCVGVIIQIIYSHIQIKKSNYFTANIERLKEQLEKLKNDEEQKCEAVKKAVEESLELIKSVRQKYSVTDSSFFWTIFRQKKWE